MEDGAASTLAVEHTLKEWLLQAPGCCERLGFSWTVADASTLGVARTLKEWLLEAPGGCERLGYTRNVAAASALAVVHTSNCTLIATRIYLLHTVARACSRAC